MWLMGMEEVVLVVAVEWVAMIRVFLIRSVVVGVAMEEERGREFLLAKLDSVKPGRHDGFADDQFGGAGPGFCGG